MASQNLVVVKLVLILFTLKFQPEVEGLSRLSHSDTGRANRGSPFNLTSLSLASLSNLLNINTLRNGKARVGGPPAVYKKPQVQAQLTQNQGQCGRGKVDGTGRKGRIVGGYSVKSPIPWQASLQSRDEFGKWKHICGAALISQFHLITASHCISSDAKYRIVLGKMKIDEESTYEQIFYVRDTDITTHRRFGYETEFGNDIAILKIQDRHGRGAVMTDFVQPICLPDHDGWEFRMLPPTSNCIVSGWGSTRGPYSEDTSNSLQVASVPIQKQETCRKLYNSRQDDGFSENWLRRTRTKRVLVGSSRSSYGGGPRYMDGMLCAGPLKGSSVDSGRGDSGGPLACKMDGQYYLVGIVSWGEHFRGSPTPGVYTRVSHYLKWLSNEKLLLGPN